MEVCFNNIFEFVSAHVPAKVLPVPVVENVSVPSGMYIFLCKLK